MFPGSPAVGPKRDEATCQKGQSRGTFCREFDSTFIPARDHLGLFTGITHLTLTLSKFVERC